MYVNTNIEYTARFRQSLNLQYISRREVLSAKRDTSAPNCIVDVNMRYNVKYTYKCL